VRGQSGGVGAEAVAGVGDERAPVSGGAVMRLEEEAREVATMRRQNEEGESWRGGEQTRPVAAGFAFKWGADGVAAEGGLVEHGRHVEEAGESKGGWALSGTASGGSGPAAARAGGALPRDIGGWRGRGDVGRCG
jgi:hypothetical protein